MVKLRSGIGLILILPENALSQQRYILMVYGTKNEEKSFDFSSLVAGGGLEPPASGL